MIGLLIHETSQTQLDDDFLAMLDQNLQEYVYKKIWAESSAKTKEILAAIAKEGGTIKLVGHEPDRFKKRNENSIRFYQILLSSKPFA